MTTFAYLRASLRNALAPAACLLLAASPAPDARAAGYLADAATSSTRGFGYPKLSDVSISSRWYRPRNGSDSHDTFLEVPAFFPTRLDWVTVDTNPTNFVQRADDRGWHFTARLSSTLPDLPGSSQRVLGRDKQVNGSYTTVDYLPNAPVIGDIWSDDYLDICKEQISAAVSNGGDGFQVDNPGMNFGAAIRGNGGHGDAADAHFRGWLSQNSTSAERQAWGLPSQLPGNFSYREWVLGLGGEANVDDALKAKHLEHLREGLDRFYRLLRAHARSEAGRSLPFSCNNTSNLVWRDEHDWADFGMAETRASNISAKKIRDWIRAGEQRGHGQVLLSPRYDADSPPAGHVDLTRRCIATTYANGGLMQVPWDVWQLGSTTRYFGTPAEYADLYGFVRAVPGYFNGYEEAFSRGQGTPTSQFGFAKSPFWTSGNDDGLYLSARVRPGNRSKAVMIHVVDWDNPQSFQLVLDLPQIFNGAAVKVHLFSPKTYNSTTHQQVIDGGSFSSLRNFEFLPQTQLANGRVRVTVPAVRPWGIVRVMLAN